MPKVKCEESARCETECKHDGEHELITQGRYGNHNCRDVARYCDYMKKAVQCVEVE